MFSKTLCSRSRPRTLLSRPRPMLCPQGTLRTRPSPRGHITGQKHTNVGCVENVVIWNISTCFLTTTMYADNNLHSIVAVRCWNMGFSTHAQTNVFNNSQQLLEATATNGHHPGWLQFNTAVPCYYRNETNYTVASTKTAQTSASTQSWILSEVILHAKIAPCSSISVGT